jgi:hypothetical protein
MNDFINGAFEFIGAVFTWRNAYQLYLDKQARGVYWPFYLFLIAWGCWNLYYYPSLEQWFSAAAGVVLVGGNIAWLSLWVYYRRLQ